MPDENNNDTTDSNTSAGDSTDTSDTGTTAENTSNNSDDSNDDSTSMENLVKTQVAEELKSIKANLDKAYKARDDAAAKVAEFELKEQEAEIERLKNDNKHKEAYDLQLQQEKAKYEALAKRNTQLTRDMEVKNLLGKYDFKSESASEMAYQTLLSGMVQNDTGDWVHRDGASMSDRVDSFMSSEEQSFLLKPVVNSGTGATTSSGAENTSKSLFDMSQEEVMQRVREGKL